MSKGQVVDAMVKLTGEEIALIAKTHIEVVEAFARKFDGHYLDMGMCVNDYRKFLDEMDKNLERAEELIKIIKRGEE